RIFPSTSLPFPDRIASCSSLIMSKSFLCWRSMVVMFTLYRSFHVSSAMAPVSSLGAPRGMTQSISVAGGGTSRLGPVFFVCYSPFSREEVERFGPATTQRRRQVFNIDFDRYKLVDLSQ